MEKKPDESIDEIGCYVCEIGCYVCGTAILVFLTFFMSIKIKKSYEIHEKWELDVFIFII